ncbi:MAG: hypothetical protein D6674_02170 [Acidobacteria bacterium]|nr:MAG: hypothetical protein D6674_02170 [Acidobacteriota bacterium]
MRKRGFALPTVIALSGIIALIITAGYTVTNIAQRTTLSTVNFQLAKEASNACIMRATDEVQATGFCGDRRLNNQQLGIQLTGGTCEVEFRQSGRICFLRSVGRFGNSEVYTTSMIQSFFGVGLYTVRGGVDASYTGGLLTGCYYEQSGNCFVPAFIASSGTISLGSANPQSCPTNQTNPNTGVWGTPPTFTNAQFRDLVPLFFNVECFASNYYRAGERCRYGLTDALVDTYALQYRDGRPDFTFSQHGEPVINQALLSDIRSTASITPQGPPNCRLQVPTTPANANINLSNLLTLLDNLIPGGASCQRVELYLDQSTTIAGTPPIPTVVYLRNPAGQSRTLTLAGVIGSPTVQPTTSFGEFIYRLVIYSGGNVNVTANSLRFRLLTTGTINVTTGLTLSEASIFQVLENDTQNNNPASPQNMIVGNGTGTLNITDSKLITRQVRFGILNAHRDLFFVYAHACPNCSRDSNLGSVNACQNDIRRCGWAGGTGTRPSMQNDAFFGTDANRNIQDATGRPLVSLLINNNSVVAGRQNFFGGIYFGQDVNYILRTSGQPNVVRGFLIRNFPANLSLSIGFDSAIDFRFRLDAINNIRYDQSRQGFPGFWFVRRVDCVREIQHPPTWQPLQG